MKRSNLKIGTILENHLTFIEITAITDCGVSFRNLDKRDGFGGFMGFNTFVKNKEWKIVSNTIQEHFF